MKTHCQNTIKNHNPYKFLARAYIKEQHTEQHEQHIQSLALEIFLLEDGCSAEEAHHHASTSDH